MGFVSLIRKINVNVITTYCLLQQEALVAKAINHELKTGLNKVWKCNYRSTKSHLSSHFVKKLKQVSFSAQRSGSYEEEKCHKCMKWRMRCLLSLILSNKNNFESCWKILGFQSYLIKQLSFNSYKFQHTRQNWKCLYYHYLSLIMKMEKCDWTHKTVKYIWSVFLDIHSYSQIWAGRWKGNGKQKQQQENWSV